MAFRVFCLFVFAALSGSCALVDQYGSRAYDGNLNTQNAINQEVLVNIIRASRYQALSWNPASQVTGAQTETLSTGLPTINFGPAQTAANHIYSITNSVSSGVSGGYTTAPLATTAFQTGMLTPVDLKTFAALTTYYPREVVFYALIAAINVKLASSDRLYARLINDPSAAYPDIDNPSDMDQTVCYRLFTHPGLQLFFRPTDKYPACFYAKFRNLLGLLITNGLQTELTQVPSQQSGQANQGNIVIGRFCFDKTLLSQEFFVQSSSFAPCGQNKRTSSGGIVQTTTTETQKFDDGALPTSKTSVTTTTTNAVLPETNHTLKVRFNGIGVVEMTFELRSPDGFLSYLGSWYKFGGQLKFVTNQLPYKKYIGVPAQRIYGDGPYLSIVNEPSAPCYTSVNYSGQFFCVPMDATHTSMLMDIAVILRNLNISPTDLNGPISVRVAN